MKNADCWYKDVCVNDNCNGCVRYAEMRYLVDNSGIPKNRQKPDILDAGKDFMAFCKLADIKDDIVEQVSRGRNIYICSKNTGNGKTSWAIKLLLKYFDEVWAGNGFRVRGYFQHVPTLLGTLKNFTQNHNVLSNVLESVDVVVWDDIASTKLSDYDIMQLLTYIDMRTLNQKANIYTGNIVQMEDLTKVVGSRLASRIWQPDSVIEFVGGDRR